MFCELRAFIFILWAWGSLDLFLSTFRVLHIVFFKFLLILESLRVFNFIFSTLDSLGFNYFFGVKFGGLWFWSYEHPQFSILCFWSLGVFNFLLVILGGLWISFGELWGIFCFLFWKKFKGFWISFCELWGHCSYPWQYPKSNLGIKILFHTFSI